VAQRQLHHWAYLSSLLARKLMMRSAQRTSYFIAEAIARDRKAAGMDHDAGCSSLAEREHYGTNIKISDKLYLLKIGGLGMLVRKEM